MGFWEMKAALEWQIAMGADEAILDAPVDRYSLPEAPPKKTAAVTLCPDGKLLLR